MTSQCIDGVWIKHSKGIDRVWGVYEMSYIERTLTVSKIILKRFYSV